jgi:hypothetical protein
VRHELGGRELQEAVFARLIGDAQLTGLLGGPHVFDGPPRNAAGPYVHLGEMDVRDWSTGSDAGSEIRFALVVWSRDGGRSQGLAAADRARALLHDAGLLLDGFQLVNLRHLSTETARAEKPEGRRVVVRFRAVVEPEGA